MRRAEKKETEQKKMSTTKVDTTKFRALIAGMDIRTQTKELIVYGNESFTIVAENLHKIFNDNLYKKWGYDTFPDYLEVELKFSYRKAKFLIDIHEKLALKGGVSKDVMSQLGWSKAKEIAGAVTDKKSAKKLVEKAKKSSVRELEKDMTKERRKVRVDNGETVEQRYNIKFVLNESQHSNVTLALDTARKMVNTEMSDSALLDCVCLYFNANAHDLSKEEKKSFVEKVIADGNV